MTDHSLFGKQVHKQKQVNDPKNSSFQTEIKASALQTSQECVFTPQQCQSKATRHSVTCTETHPQTRGSSDLNSAFENIRTRVFVTAGDSASSSHAGCVTEKNRIPRRSRPPPTHLDDGKKGE
ncbi:hypothetical protein CEXT_74321 [Caerostris extrusa]|uniref:Uncharacterized protein n=1 Tax=Caerostris extrusa TaxID=172846 RepID=A0AAV4TX29_CAEEX|nr:hypothetical protein CEXT_74321 [Caerostris extrusa]